MQDMILNLHPLYTLQFIIKWTNWFDTYTLTLVCHKHYNNYHVLYTDSTIVARRGGIEVAGWTVGRTILVRFPAYPHCVWALWWQGGKRRLGTSWCLCQGRLDTLNTPSCPWRWVPGTWHWVPGSRSKFGNWTTVPSLYSWNIAECDIKPQPTNQPTVIFHELRPLTDCCSMAYNRVSLLYFITLSNFSLARVSMSTVADSSGTWKNISTWDTACCVNTHIVIFVMKFKQCTNIYMYMHYAHM